MKIGFIGLGQMGTPMCRNIINAGNGVVVYNRTIEKTKIFQGIAEIAEDPVQLALNCDVIALMLTNSEAVSEVLFDWKIADNLTTGKVVIDFSTISPYDSIRFSEKVREKGAEYLDSPVIGSTPSAETGSLTVVVGGKKDVFEKHINIIKSIGKNVFYIGQNGSGLFIKMINNMVMGVNLAALAEALALGNSMGFDNQKLLDILSLGGAGSKVLELKKEKLSKLDFSPQFKLEHQAKDMFYAIEIARKQNVGVPISSITSQLYSSSIKRKFGSMDMSAIYSLFKLINGDDTH